MSRTDSPLNRACPRVVQQAGVATPTLQRQPAGKGVAELELELRAKLEERAMLARMLQEESDKIAADVSRRRIQTGSKKEEAKLKAGCTGRSAAVGAGGCVEEQDRHRAHQGRIHAQRSHRAELPRKHILGRLGLVRQPHSEHQTSVTCGVERRYHGGGLRGQEVPSGTADRVQAEHPQSRQQGIAVHRAQSRRGRHRRAVASWRDQLQPGPFEGRPGRHRRTRALPPVRVDRRCVLRAPADGDERTRRAVQRRTH